MSAIVLPFHRIRDEDYSHIHVWKIDSEWEVAHESRSGGSWGCFERFPTRDQAVARALALLAHYRPCKLGGISNEQ